LVRFSANSYPPVSDMKYVFLAIGFFSLGYALPGLPSFVQLAAAIFIGLLIASSCTA